MEKRTKIYLYCPQYYEFENGPICPHCGSENTTWSEYEGHLACMNCEKDFPAGAWVGDLIPVHAAAMMGTRFDMYDLLTEEVIPQDDLPLPTTDEWTTRYRQPALEAINGVSSRMKYIDDIWQLIIKEQKVVKGYGILQPPLVSKSFLDRMIKK